MDRLRRSESAAGDKLAADGSTGILRLRLKPRMLSELRLALLAYTSPFSIELELVEERYGNGDVVVRLARPDKPERGDLILGSYRIEGRPPDSLLDVA